MALTHEHTVSNKRDREREREQCSRKKNTQTKWTDIAIYSNVIYLCFCKCIRPLLRIRTQTHQTNCMLWYSVHRPLGTRQPSSCNIACTHITYHQRAHSTYAMHAFSREVLTINDYLSKYAHKHTCTEREKKKQHPAILKTVLYLFRL